MQRRVAPSDKLSSGDGTGELGVKGHYHLLIRRSFGGAIAAISSQASPA